MTNKTFDGAVQAPPIPNQATAPPQPKRALGLRDLVLFYVVATLSLRWIPLGAATGPSSLVIWAIGLAAVFLPLALCVMELSSRYPEEGGMYVWSKHAFGDFSGFLTGWVYWMSNLPYFPAVLYFAASNALYVAGSKGKALQSRPAYFLIFSFLGLALALVLNIVGLDVAKWLSNVGAIGAWLPAGLLLVIGAIALRKFGSATSFTVGTLRPSFNLANAAVWATLMNAFTGAEAASLMGGEIKHARRNIPRALLIAGVLITAGYMLGTIAVLVVLPHGQLNGLEGIMQAITASAGRLGWHGLGPAVALLICVANLGAVGAYLAATARLPFVAGIDGYLPAAFGRVHPRWHTPHIALLAQGLLSLLFVVLGQLGSSVRSAYEVLVSMTVITTFVPFLFMFAALIRLQREPAGREIVRVPGGKPAAFFIGILGFVGTCATIVSAVAPDPTEPHKVLFVAKLILLSVAVIGGGAVLYAAGSRRAKHEGSGQGSEISG
jgi:amino acid transporter